MNNVKKTWFLTIVPTLFLLLWGSARGAGEFQPLFLDRVGGSRYFPASSTTYHMDQVSVATADINSDGFLDLVVVAGSNPPDGDYAGAQVGFRLGAYVLATAGDTNAEISANLAAATLTPTFSGSDLAWFANTGRGEFRLRTIRLPGNIPPSIYDARLVRTGDLNGNGIADIVVWCGNGANPNPPNPDQGQGRVAVYENSGGANPTFTERFLITGPGNVADGLAGVLVSSSPQAGTLADIDNDNDLDVVVANAVPTNPGDNTLFWYENTGLPLSGYNNTSYQAVVIQGVGPPAPFSRTNVAHVLAARVDGDGLMDLVVSISNGPDVGLWLLIGQNSGMFREFQVATNFPSRVAAVADFDGDTVMDILAGGDIPANFTGPPPLVQAPLTLFLNQPNGGNLDPNGWTTQLLPNGDLDANDASRRVNIDSLGPGPVAGGPLWNGRVIQDLQLADLNRDNQLDILMTATATPMTFDLEPQNLSSFVHVWFRRPGVGVQFSQAGVPEPRRPKEQGGMWEGSVMGGSSAVGDFDGDGDLDVARVKPNAPMGIFYNEWNTLKHVRIKATVTKAGLTQTTTRFLSVAPDLSVNPGLWREKAHAE
jgi:hypothetical protein